MANKYTALPIPDKIELVKLYTSGLTQGQIGVIYGTTQKVIYSWFKKLGIKSRIPKKTNQRGENNHMWKGDKASYAALHYRVQSVRGKPSICSRCGSTTAKGYEWASLTKDYVNPYDYIRLCKSCHSKFDKMYLNFKTKTDAC